ncbi:MAG TPA: hypothetical protein VI010_12900 [Xanthobacteraceae bacterium]|jgi:hypothetical protein
MQRMPTVTSTLVLAVAILAPNPGRAPAAGKPADEARVPGAAHAQNKNLERMMTRGEIIPL